MDEPEKPLGGPKQRIVVERLDDLTVYIRLLNLTEELECLSNRCWSLASETALKVVARAIRSTASAIFKASLDP